MNRQISSLEDCLLYNKNDLEEAVNNIRVAMGHLGVAKIQRAPTDDPIIWEHIDRANEAVIKAAARLYKAGVGI